MTILGYDVAHSPVYGPDVPVTPHPQNEEVYIPLRGFSSIMACRRDGAVIGFVTIEDLGYDDVKAWIRDPHAPGK